MLLESDAGSFNDIATVLIVMILVCRCAAPAVPAKHLVWRLANINPVVLHTVFVPFRDAAGNESIRYRSRHDRLRSTSTDRRCKIYHWLPR